MLRDFASLKNLIIICRRDLRLLGVLLICAQFVLLLSMGCKIVAPILFVADRSYDSFLVLFKIILHRMLSPGGGGVLFFSRLLGSKWYFYLLSIFIYLCCHIIIIGAYMVYIQYIIKWPWQAHQNILGLVLIRLYLQTSLTLKGVNLFMFVSVVKDVTK